MNVKTILSLICFCAATLAQPGGVGMFPPPTKPMCTATRTTNCTLTDVSGTTTVPGTLSVGAGVLDPAVGVRTKGNFAGLRKANAAVPSLQAIVDAVITANHGTFPDAVDYWTAAPAYAEPYVVDTWYAFHGCPSCFTGAQIKAFADKVVAAKDVSGNFPLYLNHLTGGAGVYYSGCDLLQNHTNGDAAFFTPQMYLLYYQKTGDAAGATANIAALRTALDAVTLDAATHLVNIPDASPWIPWGFHDGIKKTGNDLMGSLAYYQTANAMASLYTAAGDAANAAVMTARASAIKASLTASSALWSAANGMYLAATIKNSQIDVMGSAFAVYLGVPTTAQQAAISSYLVNNYATLTKRGFVRYSPSSWTEVWEGCDMKVDNYQNGYWSVGNEWVAAALAVNNPELAKRLISEFAYNPDPTMEWYGQLYPLVASGTPGNQGYTNNLASPMAALASGITPVALDTDALPSDLIPGLEITKEGNLRFTQTGTAAGVTVKGGTNPLLAMEKADGTVKIIVQALDWGGGYFGTSTNHKVAIVTQGLERIVMLGDGTIQFPGLVCGAGQTAPLSVSGETGTLIKGACAP